MKTLPLWVGAVALAVLLPTQAIHGAVLFESAILGPTGVGDGVAVSQLDLAGVRFELTSAATATGIGGHFGKTVGQGGNSLIFGALIALDSLSDFPDSRDLDTPDVLAQALIALPDDFVSEDVSGDFDAPVELQPGFYALLYGSGLFGAGGNGFAPENNTDLVDDSQYFWYSAGAYRENPVIPHWTIIPMANTRFFLSGFTSTPPVVPEPSSLLVWGLLVGCGGFVAARQRQRGGESRLAAGVSVSETLISTAGELTVA